MCIKCVHDMYTHVNKSIMGVRGWDGEGGGGGC
jgi:hypothetical protein